MLLALASANDKREHEHACDSRRVLLLYNAASREQCGSQTK
jgi:hypothetical protein